MTKQDLLNPTQNIAIHAPTEEGAIRLMEWYKENGKKWCLGDCATDHTNWENHKENTCYNHTRWMRNSGTYDSKELFNRQGFTIITVQEFFEILEEKPQEINKPHKRTWSTEYRSSDGILVGEEIYIPCIDTKLTKEQLKELYSQCGAALKKIN